MYYVLLFFEGLRVFCCTVSSVFAKIAIFPERRFLWDSILRIDGLFFLKISVPVRTEPVSNGSRFDSVRCSVRTYFEPFEHLIKNSLPCARIRSSGSFIGCSLMAILKKC